MATGSKKRWLATAALAFAVLALLGLGVAGLMFSSWSDLSTVTPEEAARRMAAARAATGDARPFLEIDATGRVHARRELEHKEPTELRELRLLAWDPRSRRLLGVDMPFWFVRMKMTETLNLGTLTTALSGDWGNLDLRVSERDLQRRGPGLVLDHKLEDGTRLLLWTE